MVSHYIEAGRRHAAGKGLAICMPDPLGKCGISGRPNNYSVTAPEIIDHVRRLGFGTDLNGNQLISPERPIPDSDRGGSRLLYEYRRYSIVPGKRVALAQRMATVTVPLWERHGIKPVGFWEPVIGLSNELHYLLRWNDMAEREVRWNAFQADPEWILKRDQSETLGPLAASVFNELWTPTAYSPLK